MTVHGSKGLEAPIVILPDCAKRDIRINDQILFDDEGPIWRTKASESPDRVLAAIEARKAAEARERLRLLYVAMTRAETWLIVCASGDLSRDGSDWYQLVQSGMSSLEAQAQDFGFGLGKRHQVGNWTPQTPEASKTVVQDVCALEDFYTQRATSGKAAETTLSPSNLGGSKALPSEVGLDEATAKELGNYIHALFDTLGHVEKSQLETQFTSIALPGALSSDLVEYAQNIVSQCLRTPSLEWLFDPSVLSEVPLQAKISGRSFYGFIDRLRVDDDKIIAIDFKSNRATPKTPDQCPEGILRQMGAYARMLQRLYPLHRIETGILWTSTQSYMALPQDLVNDAFERARLLDDTGAAP